jgi:catechol 2,3-dioxygenase-like lactoylglutathione lyase family enzyme
MSVTSSLLRKIDAVTVPVPDLDAGLRLYRDSLGHELRWRNDRVGQAGLRLPGSDTELVLTTRQAYEPGPLPRVKEPCHRPATELTLLLPAQVLSAAR